jgi:predicted Zn-dependent protease
MKEKLRPEFDEADKAMGSGDLLRARQILLKLHRSDPESAAILAVLGHACFKLNFLDEAIEFFRKAISLAPDLEAVSLGLFHSFWKADRTDEAFDEMRRFLSEYESDEYTRLLADLKKPQIMRH